MTYGKRFNVESTTGKQPSYTGQQTRFVFYEKA
jgi:hypothetical protein